MKIPRMGGRHGAESGQVLLIAIGIILVLLICIPTVVFINHMGVRHQTHSQKEVQGQLIAEEGIAYAGNLLGSAPATWAAATTGVGTFPNPCNSGANVPGTQFRLTCTRSTALFPNMQNYEVGVIATAWMPGDNGELMAVKSASVYLSQTTLGVSLPSGLRASAALELLKVPSLFANALTVHWGPIVCLDTAGWTLVNPLDTVTVAGTQYPGYPRKISNGPITGTSALFPRSPNKLGSAISTDNREYWAYASLDFPPLPHEDDYVFGANGANTYLGVPAPFGCTPGSNCTQIPGNSGHFDVTPKASTATFNAGFTFPASSGKVIYIDGNAQFDNIAQLDLGTNGALIVTGNLQLGTSVPPATLPNVNVRLPPTAPQEYSYWPTGAATQWYQKATYDAAVAAGNAGTAYADKVHIRGFIWVKGNLVVSGPWIISGTILVGDPANGTGKLWMVSPSGSLTILYDDNVNHDIRIRPH